jgi:2,4-dienoyl-CoA reductase-like NADH-dependent reductase (Old Yellow Enzyme family)
MITAEVGSSSLFEPVTFRGVTIRNRIMVSPMCQYSAPDALPTEWHYVHLASRAVGGAGIVMTEDTAVDPIGRITPFDLGLWSDQQEAAFSRIARFVSEQGAVAGLQLGHAGRKASHSRPWEGRKWLTPAEGGWDVVAPSSLAWADGEPVPHELTKQQIADVIQKFVDSAGRAYRGGFRVLELHCAHGYLADSFLSPLSNLRTDEYGGSLRNRTRFLRELVTGVRSEWPEDLPLFVRLSCTEWVEGGWSLDDTVHVASALRGLGVDLIDCSSGGNSAHQTVSVVRGYQVPLSDEIRRRVGIPTGAVGLISDPVIANSILEAGQADLIVLGRIMLWDPYWPHHAAAVLGADSRLPVQYERSGIHAPDRYAAPDEDSE